MTQLVPIARLAEVRFEDRGATMRRRLTNLARTGRLPGARKLGAQWFCDLQEFDASAKPAANEPAPDPAISVLDMVAAARAKLRGGQ